MKRPEPDKRQLRPRPRRSITRPAPDGSLSGSPSRGRQLAELAFDAIIVMDAAGRVVELNPAAEALFGWSDAEAAGQLLDEMIVPPAYRAQHRRGIERHLASGKPALSARPRRLTALRRDGSELEIDLRLSRLDDGEQVQFVGVARPVDAALGDGADAVSAEDQRRAEATFVASLSHDIRSPLAAIITLCDLATRESDPQALRGHMRRIGANARTLRGLVGDLLDVAMLDVEHLAIEPQEVDLVGLLYSLADSEEAQIGDRPVRLEATLGPNLPTTIITDPRRLKQVLGNLLSNARKMTDRGQIELGARCLSESHGRARLQLWVSDTGPGIPPEMSRRLFERFRRSSSGVWSERAGSGLGLSICHALVRLLGGKLSFETEVGRGTTFLIEVEVEAVAEPPDLEASTTAMAIPRLFAPQHGWLLVADDTPDNLFALSETLRQREWKVQVASSGREAAAKALAGRPDAILMDVEMPDMDGIEATRLIRRTERARGERPRPIYALTGHATAEMRSRCIEAGMNGFYMKPFDMNRLHADLWALIGDNAAPEGDAPLQRDATVPAPSLEALDESIRKHLPAYFDNRRKDVEALRAAAAKRDTEGMRRLTHRLRGTCGLYGMSTLVALVTHLDQILDSGDLAAAKPGIEAFNAELERLARASSPRR